VPSLENVHTDLTGLSPEPGGGTQHAPNLNRALELQEVEFAYPDTEMSALRGLSLFIPARSTVGIVGGTGAGKTTAVDVILGLLDPLSGALVVDDVEITPANLRSWQNRLGYVPQHIFLSDGSVAANIAFGLPKEKIDMEAVERAARMASLHDFIMNELPKGYETHVGERGVRLSGGQRQRVGIARALYHDPDVLIFDEATSALDNLTERAVMEAVHKIGGQKTIIMIAHRLSTVRQCETIFLLDHGRLIAQGSYDDLVAGNETFRRMAANG
jgi:ATP-binding cassette, subfamily B, bacterial PglK